MFLYVSIYSVILITFTSVIYYSSFQDNAVYSIKKLRNLNSLFPVRIPCEKTIITGTGPGLKPGFRSFPSIAPLTKRGLSCLRYLIYTPS